VTEEGVNFREACRILDLSEKTLRKRIRAGQVEAWQVETKAGRQWRVRLPGEVLPAEEREPEDVPEPVPNPASEWLLLYRELLARHEAAASRLGYLEAEASRLPELSEGRTMAEQRERTAREREIRLRAWVVGLAVACGLLILALGLLLLGRFSVP
jgi:hypothetical protein